MKTAEKSGTFTMHTLTLALRRENGSAARGRLRIQYPLFFYPTVSDDMLICGDKLPRQKLSGIGKKDDFYRNLDNHTLTLCHRFLRAYQAKCPTQAETFFEAAMLYRVTLCASGLVSLYCDVQSFLGAEPVDFYRFGETWEVKTGLLLAPQTMAAAQYRDFKKQCKRQGLPEPEHEQYYLTGNGKPVFFAYLPTGQNRRRNRAPIFETEYNIDCSKMSQCL